MVHNELVSWEVGSKPGLPDGAATWLWAAALVGFTEEAEQALALGRS